MSEYGTDDAPTDAYEGMPFNVRANEWRANHFMDGHAACVLASRLACNAINGNTGGEESARYQAINAFLARRMKTQPPAASQTSDHEMPRYTVADAHRFAAEAIEGWGSEECRTLTGEWAEKPLSWVEEVHRQAETEWEEANRDE